MAKEFGIPPWRLEDELTQEWYDRWMTYNQTKHEQPKRVATVSGVTE